MTDGTKYLSTRSACDRHVLAGRHVVAGPDVERRADEIEPLVQLFPRETVGEATAHRDRTTSTGGGLSLLFF
ncbi:MAG: hypothetical protein OXF27_03730 [Acidobacteria bacterium]|nr:hypothetical protein [Acidobacteriota bacterium]